MQAETQVQRARASARRMSNRSLWQIHPDGYTSMHSLARKNHDVSTTWKTTLRHNTGDLDLVMDEQGPVVVCLRCKNGRACPCPLPG